MNNPIVPFPSSRRRPSPEPSPGEKTITLMRQINLAGWLAAAQHIQHDETRQQALKQLAENIGLGEQ